MDGTLISLIFLVIAQAIPQAKTQRQQRQKVDPEFRWYMLEWHNYYRGQRATSALRYNYNLEAWAQQWAERLAQYDVIEHRPPQPDPYNRMGENIYWMTLTDLSFVPSAPPGLTNRMLITLEEEWKVDFRDDFIEVIRK
uniref:Putative antigen 5/scp domain-containing protein n=1 Tax=Ixodes ricinus TaxID=34613 RepID=A0A090XC73_IXORI